MLDADQLTLEKYDRRTTRTVKNLGWGSTDGALAVADHYFDEVAEVLEEHLTKRQKNIPEPFYDLDVSTLTLIAIQGTLNTIIDTLPLSKTMFELGGLAEFEAHMWAVNNWDTVGFKRLRREIFRKYGSATLRKRAFNSSSLVDKAKWTPWTQKQKVTIGGWFVTALSNTQAFVMCGEGVNQHLALTEEANEVAEAMVEVAISRGAIHLPSKRPLSNWVSATQTIGDYRRDRLVASWSSPIERHIQRAIDDGRMNKSLSALNAIQSVPYRINDFIREVVVQCHDMGIPVSGLPPKDDIPLLKHPDWESLADGQKKSWKAKSSEILKVNRGYVGQRMEYHLDIAVATEFSGAPFYIPLRFDYRGRLTPLARFNLYRNDYVRALFQFAKGQVLTDDGLYWLKVHLANCGDFEKVSKRPFAERVAWVNASGSDISDYATDPIQYLGWTAADKPFMFLAACRALTDARQGLPVHLPVAFDGSCSGIQHLCAMTRDPGGSLVNLTPNSIPGDIYAVVAEAVEANITAEVGSEPLAKVCLDNGITRSTVKRGTMTLAYGSGIYGMSDQYIEDLMWPLATQVLDGTLDKHPYGDDSGYKAARYLAKHTYRAIQSVIMRPTYAMKFLQAIARATAHEGKPMLWCTPMGFPVFLYYPKMRNERVSLTLYDRGIRKKFNPKVQQSIKGINKSKAANASAPGFVHSMDACHLMMTSLACQAEGIKIATIHDSFACLPNDAPRLRSILVEQFYTLYSENDVLANIRKETIAQLDDPSKVPPVPEYGTLDLSLINQSEFAFS